MKQKYKTQRKLEQNLTRISEMNATEINDEIDPPINLVINSYVKDAQWKATQDDIKEWIRSETTAEHTFK